MPGPLGIPAGEPGRMTAYEFGNAHMVQAPGEVSDWCAGLIRQ